MDVVYATCSVVADCLRIIEICVFVTASDEPLLDVVSGADSDRRSQSHTSLWSVGHSV